MEYPLKPLQLEKMARRYGIVAIYAFGSRAAEISALVQGAPFDAEFDKSDVDLGILLSADNSLSIRDKVRLAAELEDLFSANRVDLVVLQEADPFVAADIVRGELIYCENEDSEAEYQLYVLRRAGDLAYHKRELMDGTLKRRSI